jgi:competence protein ComEA
MRNYFIEYFSFTQGQTRAVIVLMSAIIIASGVYFFLPQIIGNQSGAIDVNVKKLQVAIVETESNQLYNNRLTSRPIAKLTPFQFNPNTLDSIGFKRLGLPDKLVSTILNFRNKGGKFYNKESLKRIYGLHNEEYKQLENYISIPNEYSTTYANKASKEVLHIELNTADTAQLVKLKGIGSKLAMNIVQKREALGGFANLNQLTEVYGISAQTIEWIKSSVYINTASVHKLNLNASTYYELNAHPYLRGEIATAIVDYRKAHDYKIDNLNQLKEIPLINDELFRKIVPYLSL